MPAARRHSGIRAVAAKAAVSVATASRYLNGKGVKAEARRRLAAAVQELGYSPNRVAQSLRRRRTMTLGMIIPDITNPFFPAVVKGAEDAARAAGFVLVLLNAGDDGERERDCLATVHSLRCDGLLMIMAPALAHRPRPRHELRELKLPVVYVATAPDFDADLVRADDVLGAEQAVRHLISLGHTRIGCVAADSDLSVHKNRFQGYLNALLKAGLPEPQQLVVEAHATVADGYSAASRLLSLPQRPTAIFATSYRLTIGSMSAIERNGLGCPADVSVIGYDSYDWQDVFHPRLSVIVQPTYLMGARAAELLVARLSGRETGPPEHVLLDCNLVLRESCAPPPKDASR